MTPSTYSDILLRLTLLVFLSKFSNGSRIKVQSFEGRSHLSISSHCRASNQKKSHILLGDSYIFAKQTHASQPSDCTANFLQAHASSSKLMQAQASSCKLKQAHASSIKLKQAQASSCKLKQAHASS